MILPSGEPAVRVYRSAELVETGGAIEVVLNVVLACPQQLHRNPGLPGNPRRLDHVVVSEASAKAPAATYDVDRNVFRCDLHRRGDELPPRLRILRRRPDLELAVAVARGAVHGLESGVGEERILVCRLHYRGASECRVHIAVVTQRALRRRGKVLGGFCVERGGALRGCRMLAPRDTQALPSRASGPPAVGDDGYAA